MTKLEKKIIRKVYTHETKKTTTELLGRILTIGFVLATVLYIGSLLIRVLDEQGTLEVFEIFHEDADVVRTYFFEVVGILYQEIPKHIAASLILAVVALLFLIVLFIKSVHRISQKLRALRKYWFSSAR